jgi:hypothetical protein
MPLQKGETRVGGSTAHARAWLVHVRFPCTMCTLTKHVHVMLLLPREFCIHFRLVKFRPVAPDYRREFWECAEAEARPAL